MKARIIRSAQTVFFSAVVAVALTSCGNNMGKRALITSSSSAVNYGATADLPGLSGTGFTNDGAFTCPNSPNIHYGGDADWYGGGEYIACKNNTSAYSVMVHGKTLGSTTICAFPAQYVDSSHLYFKPDLSTGLPLSTCEDISTGKGLTLNYPGVNFNALFIVEESDRAAMQNCLALGAPNACPNYSYGKFR